MFNIRQFSELIIRPSLYAIDSYSLHTEYLLLGTCAQESKFGTYLKQTGGSDLRLGIFQMEPKTHDAIINWAINIEIWPKILSFLGNNFSSHRMVYDLNYATILAALCYLRADEPLYDLDIIKLARYWKRYYSTDSGKGTEEDFVKNWILYGI